ncbi:A24 family peptidase [Fusibacillus kribbianus]|uniref:Prepilin peptidase n=1 Tax=Fusibacillus kribbianus TaxID=3044208 RepID=A0AAP4BC16_9FIRM|nr:prepilin peptidase [Ruminococcus sp. YH-rum2234]MDI9242423.1 prepilin peptidase [Ruminococcus sp. YH-rum2234]
MKWQLFVVCAVAAVTDIRWRRIPDFWLEIWFFTGLLLAGLFPEGMAPSGEPAGTAASAQAAFCCLCRAAAVFLLFYPAWRLRMTGAGDVKLCSVMAAFMGIPDFAECFLYSLLFGSIFSFFYLLFHRSLRRRLRYFLVWFGQCISQNRWLPYRREQDMDGTIPFAAALLLGYGMWLF